MKDRFDLENDIMALYSSAEDLKTVTQMMYDSDFIYDADRTWNTLYGLAEVIEAKVGKAMDTFSQVFKLDQYAPQEIKDQRDLAMEQIRAMRGMLKDAEDSVEQVFPNMAKMAEGWEEEKDGM